MEPKFHTGQQVRAKNLVGDDLRQYNNMTGEVVSAKPSEMPIGDYILYLYDVIFDNGDLIQAIPEDNLEPVTSLL